jgi:tRNA(Ile)-lysidine synthase
MLKQFQQYIKQNHLFNPKDKLLLAVSGGADSVVLCELCYQAGYDFAIAHCNFQLRGEESDRNEKFVKDLAAKYKVEVFVKQFDTEKYAEEKKLSIQVAARELRYEWFAELRDSLLTNRRQPAPIISEGLQPLTGLYILTAHHADDNVETLLMNFFKGTGIKGLRGMRQHEGIAKITRPLLFAKRKDIEEFAKENNIAFVEDSSNATDKYTRNYFRHVLIPSIQEKFPQVEDNLVNNIAKFGEIETLYNQALDLHKSKLCEVKGNEVHIPVLKLAKAKPLQTIVYEIVREFGFTALQTTDIINLLQADSGKYIQSSTHRIIRNRKWLIISPKNTNEAVNILIEEGDTNVQCAMGNLQFKKSASLTIHQLPLAVSIDANKITFPLLLRKWKQGDYFYPLGMKHKKKLSRFFIDNKLSIIEKENAWVIESNKKIIWVVGMRIDDRFKITDNTKEVLEITFKNADALISPKSL